MQDDEEIGDVYQDEVNQAALLLYKDREDDALLMVRADDIRVCCQVVNQVSLSSFRMAPLVMSW